LAEKERESGGERERGKEGDMGGRLRGGIGGESRERDMGDGINKKREG
jgi:hypothetical protein